MSLSTKFVEASLSVKVIVAVPLLATVVTFDVMKTVGATVSTVMLSGVATAVLLLPAASVKTPAATEMFAVPVKPAVGVKIAVYVVPLPAKYESVPLVAVMSPTTKFVEASLSVKVIGAVPLPATVVTLDVISTVGATLSIERVRTGVDCAAVPVAFVKLSKCRTCSACNWGLPSRSVESVSVRVMPFVPPVNMPPPMSAGKTVYMPTTALLLEVSMTCNWSVAAMARPIGTVMLT